MGCRGCADQNGVMLGDSVLTWTFTALLLLTSGSWQREISDFSEKCSMAVLQLPGADSSSGGQVHLSDSPREAGKRQGAALCHSYSEYRGCFVLTWVFLAHSVFQVASPQVQALTSLTSLASSWWSCSRPHCHVPAGAGSPGSSAALPGVHLRPWGTELQPGQLTAPEHRSEWAVLGEHILEGPGEGFAL